MSRSHGAAKESSPEHKPRVWRKTERPAPEGRQKVPLIFPATPLFTPLLFAFLLLVVVPLRAQAPIAALPTVAPQARELWKQGEQAAAEKRWPDAVRAWHETLAALEPAAMNGTGEAWEPVDPSVLPLRGLGEQTREALRALPPEAIQIAREQYDEVARAAVEQAIANENPAALLSAVRRYPLSTPLPRAYRHLAEACIVARRWERARAWLERFRSDFPEAFFDDATRPNLLADVYVHLADAPALLALADFLENYPTFPENPATPDEVPVLWNVYREMAAKVRASAPIAPFRWEPGDCAPPLGAPGPLVWNLPIALDREPPILRGHEENRPPLFPYQLVVEDSTCWLLTSRAVLGIRIPSGTLNVKYTLPPSEPDGEPRGCLPDPTAGWAMPGLSRAWIAAVVGPPILQRNRFRMISASRGDAPYLFWIDRDAGTTTVIDTAAPGPLQGALLSPVPAIAADLPVLWRYTRRPDGNWTYGLCCLDPATDTPVWNVEVGAVRGNPQMADFRGPFERNALFRVRGTTLFACDQVGFIVAVDILTGALLWAHPFEPAGAPADGGAMPPQAGWAPNPILLTDDTVLVAPLHGRHLLALDAATGKRLWQADREKARHLLGVRQGVVFTSGEQVQAREVRQGRLRWEPVIIGRGPEPGRGLVAEDGIYLPTGRGLVVLDYATGKIRESYSWMGAARGMPMPGNLAAADGHLLIALEDRLLAFRTGIAPMDPEHLQQTLEEIFRDLRSDRWSAREEASRRLLEIGALAQPVLERATHDPDPDIVWRAHKLLDVMREGLLFIPMAQAPQPPTLPGPPTPPEPPVK